jgi:hypothetical protein
MKQLEAEAIVKTILDVEAPTLQFILHTTPFNKIFHRGRIYFISVGGARHPDHFQASGSSWESAISSLRMHYQIKYEKVLCGRCAAKVSSHV